MSETRNFEEHRAASKRRQERIRPGANRILCDGTDCTVCGRGADPDELVEVEGVGEELICSRCIFQMIRKLEYSEGSRPPGERYPKGDELLTKMRRLLSLP
jgi:hypothetical protein